MQAQLTGGFARSDITPELGTLLMGYPTPDRKAESVRDALQANALALKQGDTAAIIISLTVCIVADVEVATIRCSVAEATGVAAEHITVCSTQTHSAPCTQQVWGWCDKDDTYIQRMVAGAIEAAVKAAQDMRPVRVGIGTGSSEVGINRRAIREDHSVALGVNPWGVYDPEMTVLRFASEQGPLATLIHYGAHPTVLGSSSRAVSRDWPGVMIDRVEALTEAPAFFVNGAVGDIAPRTNILSAVGDGEMALMEVGCRGASDALRIYCAIKEFRVLDLGVHCGDFQLLYRPLADKAEAQEQLKEAEPHKDESGKGMCEYKHWQAVLCAHEAPPVIGKPYSQVVTRLGPVALVPFPGEPFAEIVLRLRDLSPFEYTLCASTSCGNNGYFVTRDSLHRGGYEVWVAKAFGAQILAEHIDDILIEENLALLRSLEEG
jgi:hypothetical protein